MVFAPIRSTVIILAVFVSCLKILAQTNPYESDIRAFEQADLRNPPPTNSILFLGSSTIVRWDSLAAAFPRFNVLNRGFGGSQASDVLFFYDRIVPPYHPPLIVFYEGDNDLASGKSVDQVFSAWTNFVSRVERDLPDSHILFVAVKPSPSRINIIARQRELNERVLAFNAANPKLLFADVFTPMLNSAGQPRPELYVSDQLHLSAAGYVVWEAAIVPVVEAWAARYPVNVMKAERNALLIDFGYSDSLSGQPDPSIVYWNNISTIGASNTGALSNLLTSTGIQTPVDFQMVSRFNGANENGTTSSTNFPTTATRDSLFGNTETFNGLANVTPIFNLIGLDPALFYRVTFYASRTGVSENRETLYTVTGADTQSTTLNIANNIDDTAIINFIKPDASGILNIALTPGPNNNNANHFTYLGVLRVELITFQGPVFLFDFGASGSTTTTQSPPPSENWNNLTLSIGSRNDGGLDNLVTTNSVATSIDIQMLSRFSGADLTGTSSSTNFVSTATIDSLYGNTGLYHGVPNTTPAFKFTGLNPAANYSLTFFASRTRVSDDRETRYTAIGAATNFVDLNPSNNTNNLATIPNLRSGTNGEIKIQLTPGPNNNHTNLLTHIGVLRLDWTIPTLRDALLLQPTKTANGFEVQLRANAGVNYRLESSTNLVNWSELRELTLTQDSLAIDLPPGQTNSFYRALKL
jgi:lysophospholipase L1-like esterase